MTYDPNARLAGAQERARRLLENERGLAKPWPTVATPYRDALRELLDASHEATIDEDEH